MMKQNKPELLEIGYDHHPMRVEARNIAGKFDEKWMTSVKVLIFELYS
jgi:hypothetical protein